MVDFNQKLKNKPPKKYLKPTRENFTSFSDLTHKQKFF